MSFVIESFENLSLDYFSRSLIYLVYTYKPALLSDPSYWSILTSVDFPTSRVIRNWSDVIKEGLRD